MSKMAVVVGNVTKSAPSGEGFIESTYVAPVYDSSARDFGSDFLLILILPLLVVFVIAIILGIIFFCFREGRSVPWSYFVRELCLYFLIKGLFTWRGEYPSTRKILEGRWSKHHMFSVFSLYTKGCQGCQKVLKKTAYGSCQSKQPGVEELASTKGASL